ncbi:MULTISPECIES: hypothetical protein [Bacillus]|uniref:hypothetical protein n=1 Tax=Bacillus TaxID=1386 RepID=UPI000849D596|nr:MULTISPECIES: hypothetical protein [Bacillus]MBL3611706.1 hypothetical protein [Bacillus sp. RHFS18]KAF6545594.1 hypothetical protein G9F51_14525 [Bacillus sp. EKM207B]KAF6546567.1 hypothetical protein G9F50_13030 [Bacillus sp. EKM206B]KAF6554887.1 hypothetical protein G9F47_12420 [Bacillus sp. EKM203B]ODS06753.1 hypothetical protein BSHJ18_01184 [Bacillus velezensis]
MSDKSTTFSVFRFYNYESIDNFIETLRNNLIVSRQKTVDNLSDTLYARVEQYSDEFPLFQKNIVDLEGFNNINYISFNLLTESPKNTKCWVSDEMMIDRQERVKLNESKVLVFEYDGTVDAIVFCGLHNAKTPMKSFFTPETWGIVSDLNLDICDDLLFWIAKQYLHPDSRNQSLSKLEQVFITDIEKYSGSEGDGKNTCTGAGNGIDNLYTTTAFLINNAKLKSLKAKVQVGREHVLVELKLTGSFMFWIKSYNGILRRLSGEHKTNAIAIFLYMKLIPIIIDCYKTAVKTSDWSPEIKSDFLQYLRDRLVNEVEQGRPNLNN